MLVTYWEHRTIHGTSLQRCIAIHQPPVQSKSKCNCAPCDLRWFFSWQTRCRLQMSCTTGCFLATSTDLLLFPDRKPDKWKGLGTCLPSKMKLSKCCKSVSEIRLRDIMHCRRPLHHLFGRIGMMNHTSQLLRYIITWNKLVYRYHNIVDG